MASGSAAMLRRAAELRPSRLYVFMSDSPGGPPLPLAPPCTFEDHQDPHSGQLTSHITHTRKYVGANTVGPWVA